MKMRARKTEMMKEEEKEVDDKSEKKEKMAKKKRQHNYCLLCRPHFSAFSEAQLHSNHYLIIWPRKRYSWLHLSIEFYTACSSHKTQHPVPAD
jgi:hypothetical protein